ncbi:hypothetical protein [Paraburkholderia sp. RL17-381-BIF-C]|uniref:hypothetical protein n=1 Tax=Paraburkholderia sp. RL17-381-BIF-C TaxID=3031635 RepID=UPI0038BCA8C6
MAQDIKVLPSEKTGISSREKAVVVCDGILYLRILGSAHNYELMTATASEHIGFPVVCNEQTRLIAAANQLRTDHGGNPAFFEDRAGRKYVKICKADTILEFEPVIAEFFEIYDRCEVSGDNGKDEMREVYEAISPSDSDEDLYLSDGLWLSSDGLMSDRGR